MGGSEGFQEMQADLKKFEAEWRASPDPTNPEVWPCIASGPAILTFVFDRVVGVAHIEAVEDDLASLSLTQQDDIVGFLMYKLAAHRAAGGPVSAAQVERIAWAAGRVTGVEVSREVLSDTSKVRSQAPVFVTP